MTLVIVRTGQGEWEGGPRPVGVIEEFLGDQAFAGWEFVDLAPHSLKQVIEATGTFFDVIANRVVFCGAREEEFRQAVPTGPHPRLRAAILEQACFAWSLNLERCSVDGMMRHPPAPGGPQPSPEQAAQPCPPLAPRGREPTHRAVWASLAS